jgi:RNA polymerase sigma-70 factor, ECF subfamily
MSDASDVFGDFAALYRAHLDSVLAYCVARTGSPELAADVAAEVFAAALIGWGRYRGDRRSAEQWLLGIAAHKIADAQRRGHVERRAQRKLGIARIEWTDADLERVSAIADSVELMDLRAQLPGDQRSAVQARVVDEQAYAETALSSGVSQAAVRKRVSRGPRDPAGVSF